MMINKKLLLSLTLLITNTFSSLTASLANAANELESGKARVSSIMTNDETGITAYTKKNIEYAEVLNIANDLNSSQITEYFGCKTLIGKQYFKETLEHPVSPKNISSVVANRQQCIKTLVENASLKKEVEKILSEAQQAEQDIIVLLSDEFRGRTCPELKQLQITKEQYPRLFPIANFLHTDPTGKTVNMGKDIAGLVSTYRRNSQACQSNL